jgi:hypothetical protein
MQTASLQDGRWESIVARIGEVVDLEATAREFGAIQRVRKIKSAAGLLRLALMYGPGGQSMASAAALAGDAGIAALTDKAVEGRLRKMADWLAHILTELLAHEHGAAVGGLDLGLVDGSLICARGGDWRLHARYDPARGRFGDLTLTSARDAERVDRNRIIAGQVIVNDRGYARVRNFQDVLAADSDFLTRIGWRSLRLQDADGHAFDLMAKLPEGDAPIEHTVHLLGIARPLRLVLQRIPPAAAERQRRKRVRKSRNAGHQIDTRTEIAAGYLMLLTSLPLASQPTEAVVRLYRSRWQVELGFKRLKSLGGIDRLPASDPDIARAWLLAHLIAAVLTDELANELVGFPPSAALCETTFAVARLENCQAGHTDGHSATPKATIRPTTAPPQTTPL